MLIALTDQQMVKAAPSIFAKEPHPRVSHQYGFVPTIDLIQAFRQEGWDPVRVLQSRVRDYGRKEHTRHMVRLRRLRDPIAVGDALAELVLTNSHDGSSAYHLDIGLLRLACLNGMVSSIGDGGGIRVRHGKNVVHDVIEGSCELLDDVPKIAASVERFREITLIEREQELYAEKALAARYGNDWKDISPVSPRSLLYVRRSEDSGGGLWKTFNRVQENLLKGGLPYRSAIGKRGRTRAITSVSEDVRLNRALWRLTEHFAQLKSA